MTHTAPSVTPSVSCCPRALDLEQIARRLEEQIRNGDPVRRQRAVELLASMPLDAVPASVRWRVRLTRGRSAVQNLYERHLAAPERRVALGIAILLLFIAGVAYLALSANYFVTQSSRTLTPGESVAVVRGHPNFRLGEDVIVTDFRRPDFPAASMDTINHSELRGYGWPWRLGDDGYLQQLLPLLSPEPAARSRWFLGDGQRAELVGEMASYLGTDIKPFGMNVLEQMMTLDPSLATGELFETTQSLFQDQNPVVRQEATHLIYRLCDLEPSLAPDCMRVLLNQVNIDRSDAVHREIMAGMAGLLADQEAPLAPDLAAGLVQLLMHRNYGVYLDARSLVAQAAEKHPDHFVEPRL